jgi:hypothetical protein
MGWVRAGRSWRVPTGAQNMGFADAHEGGFPIAWIILWYAVRPRKPATAIVKHASEMLPATVSTPELPFDRSAVRSVAPRQRLEMPFRERATPDLEIQW